MRLIPADPDVRTIVARIREGDIDLQPEFQRGEVWSEAKRRRLIDSILRNWHVPPIHVVEIPGSNVQEVLDGQQRLAAIRDFAAGEIRIDGNSEPADPNIVNLDGLTYHKLPAEWRRRFDQFTIRIISITDYAPGEPAELFYRLNQPVALTSAEQRNAFFGIARNQVRQLVRHLEENGIDKTFIGFSNARMAYDDVLARLCVCLDAKSLTARVTAQTLASVYRSDKGFSPNSLSSARETIELFGHSKEYVGQPARFNKATFFSWLWFATAARQAAANDLGPRTLGEFVRFFEQRRAPATKKPTPAIFVEGGLEESVLLQLMALYNDRATSRVSDTSSIVARDAVIWAYFDAFSRSNAMQFPPATQISILRSKLSSVKDQGVDAFLTDLVEGGWGRLS